MVGGAGLHSRGRSSLQRPECETEPSSFIWSGAWCSMEIVGDRAADGTHGHTVTRSNMQSGSFSCLLTAIANALSASPLAFLPFPHDTFDIAMAAAQFP